MCQTVKPETTWCLSRRPPECNEEDGGIEPPKADGEDGGTEPSKAEKTQCLSRGTPEGGIEPTGLRYPETGEVIDEPVKGRREEEPSEEDFEGLEEGRDNEHDG